MRKGQQAVPCILDSDGTRPLVRVPYSDRRFNETWLKNLLFENPSLLPVEEIEPAFAPLTSLARELPTDAGPLDLLFVSPLGYITIGETKLVRNPEARREVVAQTLDYAKELSQWTYDDLISAIKRTRDGKLNKLTDPIFEAVKDNPEEDDFDAHQFKKAIG